MARSGSSAGLIDPSVRADSRSACLSGIDPGLTKIYALGPFRLNAEAGGLTHAGVPVALGARAVAVLATLVERAGDYVPKSSIIDAAWADVVVEESNLAVQISAIRRVLAQTPGGERWIETLARRGYRYVGPVTVPLGRGAPRRRERRQAFESARAAHIVHRPRTRTRRDHAVITG